MRLQRSVLVAEAEVGFDDARVGGQFGARAGQLDLAGFQHVAVVGYLQRGAGVLLDEQDGDAGFLERRDGAEDFLDDQRCQAQDRKSTRLNSSHITISYAVFCLKKKKT